MIADITSQTKAFRRRVFILHDQKCRMVALRWRESKTVRISSSFNDRQVRGNISTPIVSNFRLRRSGRMNAGVAVMFDYGQHC
jgi:hypothetical protein